MSPQRHLLEWTGQHRNLNVRCMFCGKTRGQLRHWEGADPEHTQGDTDLPWCTSVLHFPLGRLEPPATYVKTHRSRRAKSRVLVFDNQARHQPYPVIPANPDLR